MLAANRVPTPKSNAYGDDANSIANDDVGGDCSRLDPGYRVGLDLGYCFDLDRVQNYCLGHAHRHKPPCHRPEQPQWQQLSDSSLRNSFAHFGNNCAVRLDAPHRRIYCLARLTTSMTK